MTDHDDHRGMSAPALGRHLSESGGHEHPKCARCRRNSVSGAQRVCDECTADIQARVRRSLDRARTIDPNETLADYERRMKRASYDAGALPPWIQMPEEYPRPNRTPEQQASYDAGDHVDAGQHAPRLVYPSFYAAVHRAWNGFFDGTIFACGGVTPYEPDEHRCFEFAGDLRVELHAAGIRLSNDGNAMSDAILQRLELDHADRLEAMARPSMVVSEADMRERLAAAEANPYGEMGVEVHGNTIEPVKPEATWRRWISRLLGRQVF